MYSNDEIKHDIEKFSMKVKSNVIKRKQNPLDEHQTEYVDLDLVISYYLDEYRTIRKKN
jgi:hypothetical protein